MDTLLPPIEKPKGPVMKLAYSMARRQFGRVPTPVKVVYARMPAAFGMFAGKISELDKKLELPAETAFLIREQVAHINICEFCMDIGRMFVIKARMNEAKFDALQDYRTSRLFSEAERAALDYVTELTRNKTSARDLRASEQKLFRTGHLRDRVACGQRALLQHDQSWLKPIWA